MTQRKKKLRNETKEESFKVTDSTKILFLNVLTCLGDGLLGG